MKEKISAEEVKRVKALGCLKDKRYEDIFNVRVLTRNGKITAQEARAIAEAAERAVATENSSPSSNRRLRIVRVRSLKPGVSSNRVPSRSVRYRVAGRRAASALTGRIPPK